MWSLPLSVVSVTVLGQCQYLWSLPKSVVIAIISGQCHYLQSVIIYVVTAIICSQCHYLRSMPLSAVNATIYSHCHYLQSMPLSAASATYRSQWYLGTADRVLHAQAANCNKTRIQQWPLHINNDHFTSTLRITTNNTQQEADHGKQCSLLLGSQCGHWTHIDSQNTTATWNGDGTLLFPGFMSYKWNASDFWDGTPFRILLALTVQLFYYRDTAIFYNYGTY